MRQLDDRGLIRISACEVCGGADLRDVVDLGEHPMCDDLIPVGDARRSTTYPIRISFCPTCRTAHQNYQIPKGELFPTTYHYRARHTADVLTGMRQLVERCRKEIGPLDRVRVLDIGCNDGSLLSIFAEHGAKTLGVEPTNAAADARRAGHDVHERFLDPGLAKEIVTTSGRPDIITFTNVFAHIEDLSQVLASVRMLLAPQTLLVIENHYLGAVLERHQFDTFYHEHPRTYSETSFVHIAAALDARIVASEFPARYGGNIRVLMRVGKNGSPANAEREADFEGQLREMDRRIPLWRAAKRAALEAAVARHGPLPGKAFPGRAAILVKLLEIDETMISAVYEKPGSMKIGHYLPGTRIQILSDEDFPSRPSPDAPLVNLAWHIASEIHGYMRAQGFQGEIIDLFSKDEFEAAA